MVNINKKRLFSKDGREGTGLAGKVDPKNVSDVCPKMEITTPEAAWLEADEAGRESIRIKHPVFAETMEERHPETAKKKKDEHQKPEGFDSKKPPDNLDGIPTLHDIEHDPTHKEGDVSQPQALTDPEKGDEEIPATTGNGGDGNNNGKGGPPPDPEPEEPNQNPQPQKKESEMTTETIGNNKQVILLSIILVAVGLVIGGVGASLISKSATEKEAAARVGSAPAKTGESPSDIVLTAGKSFQGSHPIGEEGVVYMDSEGNTYERHTLGWRECKYYANGVFIKRYFVGDTSKPHNKDETYNQCKLLGKVLAAEMKPTTPYKMETALTK